MHHVLFAAVLFNRMEEIKWGSTTKFKHTE
jgi:hypothetical protein